MFVPTVNLSLCLCLAKGIITVMTANSWVESNANMTLVTEQPVTIIIIIITAAALSEVLKILFVSPPPPKITKIYGVPPGLLWNISITSHLFFRHQQTSHLLHMEQGTNVDVRQCWSVMFWVYSPVSQHDWAAPHWPEGCWLVVCLGGQCSEGYLLEGL